MQENIIDEFIITKDVWDLPTDNELFNFAEFVEENVSPSKETLNPILQILNALITLRHTLNKKQT